MHQALHYSKSCITTMKIEVLLCDSINERLSNATCFEASPSIKKVISDYKPIQGIVIIDNVPVKFHFSSRGMDGEIFTQNPVHRTIVKTVVPVYVFNLIENGALTD